MTRLAPEIKATNSSQDHVSHGMQGNVLIVAPYFPPVEGAGVFRTTRFVKFLPQFGLRPRVLSLAPGVKSDESLLSQLPQDLEVVRVPLPGQPETKAKPELLGAPELRISSKRKNVGLIGRIKQLPPCQWIKHFWQLLTQTPDKYVAWNKAAIAAAKQMISREPPHVILTSGPPHSVHLIGKYLKSSFNIPWIADFRDPWARRPWGEKPENPWGQRFYSAYERACVQAADRVILNTAGMKEEFVSYYSDQPPSKFLVIPNGCDPDLAEKVQQILERTPSRAATSPVRLCHPGALYRERDPRPLMAAVGQLVGESYPIRFDQIGPFDPQFALQDFIQQNNLGHSTSVCPGVTHNEILQEMAKSDVLVLLQPRTPIQVPGKLFEMMLFGKPILALCHEGNTADLIREYHLGVVADPDSSLSIADALRKMLSQLQESSTPGSADNWRHARDAFDAEHLTGLLAAQFTALSQPHEHHQA